MKKSLRQFPPEKRVELERIASVVRQRCDDVEMIILFGSYARGEWKEEADLKPRRRSGHKSDYDVLVVVRREWIAEDVDIWYDVNAKCKTLELSAHVRVIAHDIESVNDRLEEGQYFFSDIKKEGCLLYDSGRCELARARKLEAAEQKRIAQGYYDQWFGTASSFYRHFEFELKEGVLRLAAFHLNQAAEACLKTILVVFTGYIPHEHRLRLLEELVIEQDESVAEIFPAETGEQRQQFEMLDCAYIGGRYDMDFRVFRPDLEYLAGRVKLLLELTERICTARIASID